MANFKAGDIAYIVESNNRVCMVTIKRYSGGFYLVTLENGGGIKVREKRLFHTKEDATSYILSIGRTPREKIPESPSATQNSYPDAPPNLKSSAAMYHREK